MKFHEDSNDTPLWVRVLAATDHHDIRADRRRAMLTLSRHLQHTRLSFLEAIKLWWTCRLYGRKHKNNNIKGK